MVNRLSVQRPPSGDGGHAAPYATERDDELVTGHFGVFSVFVNFLSRGKLSRSLAVFCVLTAAVTVLAPPAGAVMNSGNYALDITGRYDFHTWIWAISRCEAASECRSVTAIPMPVARAFPYTGEAPLVDGRYTLTVDVPDGLRCGNVYYGPVVPTRDVYSWDATTLQGTMESSFATGCDGAPGGTYFYPFTLSLM